MKILGIPELPALGQPDVLSPKRADLFQLKLQKGLDPHQPLAAVPPPLSPSGPSLTLSAWPPEKCCLVSLWPLAGLNGTAGGFMALLVSQLIIKVLLPQEEDYLFLSPFSAVPVCCQGQRECLFSTPSSWPPQINLAFSQF